MATIDSKDIIDAIIAANGRQYADEPPVVRITQYTNRGGGTSYGVVWQGDQDPYRYEEETSHVRNPKVIWPLNATTSAVKCTMCKKPHGEFRDNLSRKEATISGLCQACQDDFFAVPEDDYDDPPSNFDELVARGRLETVRTHHSACSGDNCNGEFDDEDSDSTHFGMTQSCPCTCHESAS